MLMKPCAKCNKLIPCGQRYCDTCKPKAEQEHKEARQRINQRYNAKRDSKYKRFYNSKDWGVLSKRYMQDKQYHCEECGALATQVHHKEPIQTPNGWLKRLDYDNLQLLCIDCHNKKHDRFVKREIRK